MENENKVYIFYGQPRESVTTRKKILMGSIKYKTIELFHFDENGEYITNDTVLIEKLKPHFKYKILEEEIKVEEKKTKKGG